MSAAGADAAASRRVSELLVKVDEHRRSVDDTRAAWAALDASVEEARSRALALWADDGEAGAPQGISAAERGLVHSAVHCDTVPCEVLANGGTGAAAAGAPPDDRAWCRSLFVARWAASRGRRWTPENESPLGRTARRLLVPPPSQPPMRVRPHEALMIGPIRSLEPVPSPAAPSGEFSLLRRAAPRSLLRCAAAVAAAASGAQPVVEAAEADFTHRTSGTLADTGVQVWLAALRLADALCCAALGGDLPATCIAVELAAGMGFTAAALRAVQQQHGGRAPARLFLTDVYASDAEWAEVVRRNAAAPDGTVALRHLDWLDPATIPFPHLHSPGAWRAFVDSQPAQVPAGLRWAYADRGELRRCRCFLAADVMYDDAVTAAFAGVLRAALAAAPGGAVAVVAAEVRTSLWSVIGTGLPPPDEAWLQALDGWRELRLGDARAGEDPAGALPLSALFPAPADADPAAAPRAAPDVRLFGERLLCAALPRLWGGGRPGVAAAPTDIWRVRSAAESDRAPAG